MSAWREIAVPAICERMLGFSVPRDGEVLVVAYDGVYILRLDSPITVERDDRFAEYDIYDPDTGIAKYRGRDYAIIGLHGGVAIESSPQGERLVLDSVAETLSVEKGGKSVWEIQYSNFSGDWAAATFCPDGRFIILGCPYDLDFKVFERAEVDA